MAHLPRVDQGERPYETIQNRNFILNTHHVCMYVHAVEDRLSGDTLNLS
jgi:hypothetical protein